MPAQTQSLRIHPQLLTMLAARFPAESPAQLHDRALEILELSEKLKQALSDFWATTTDR
jgi:hypothetical protein